MSSSERVQQRTAEQAEDAPQSPEETVEMRWVSRERVQQRTAEQTEDAPQSPEETRREVQQRTAEQTEDVPQISGRDRPRSATAHCRTD